MLIQTNTEPAGIFYLRNGIVKQYAVTSNGQEIVVNVFHSPAFFPMSWAITGARNEYYFEAQSDVLINLAPASAVLQFLRQNPDIALDLLSRVYRGTNGLTRRLVYVLAGDKYGAVINELLISARRFGQPTDDGKGLQVNINQQDIAEQSGMARETVSREMTKLKNQGLINFERQQLIIPDISQLEAELQRQ